MKKNDNLNKSGRRDAPSPATISDETLESLVRKDEIRKEVEAQIRKEVEFLRESLGLSIKIVSVSVMLFLALLGYFGYTTWEGFEKKSVSIMEEKTDKLITKNDSETGVKYKLTSLLNKAVVDSALISGLNKSRVYKDRVGDQLPVGDWERISASLEDKNLSLQDFEDTLTVLNAQSDDRKRINSIYLMDFINPINNGRLDSVRSKPEKIEAVLNIFKDKNLGVPAVNIIFSGVFDDSLKEKAANYVREVGYSGGVSRLMDGYDSIQDGPAKRATLIACLLLRPNEPKVLRELNELNLAPGGYEKASMLADIILAVAKNMSDSGIGWDVKAMQAVANSVFEISSKSGVFFSYALDDEYHYEYGRTDQGEEVDREILEPSGLPAFEVRVSAPGGDVSEYRGKLGLETMKNFGYYWRFIMNSANSGDLESVKTLLPRVYNRRSEMAYEKFNKSFRIIVKGTKDENMLVKTHEGKTENIVFPRVGECQVSVETNFGNYYNDKNERDNPVLYLECADVHEGHKVPVIDLKGKGYIYAIEKKGAALDFDPDFYPEYDDKYMGIGP